jgi:pimeloyl-ACP methyl ester carboxylesterase
VDGAGWDYGTERSYLRELVEYWLTRFDWRAQERLINALPQFRAPVNGLDIHFVYVRGTGPRPYPLVITHGWPSSFFEMHRIIGPLADPASHGGDPADAFDVVVPSMPGFGFSERPARRGLVKVDVFWRTLMTDVLGYRRFGAHGSDVGARVTSALGRFHPEVVSGIHIGSVDLDWPEPLPSASELSAAERDYLASAPGRRPKGDTPRSRPRAPRRSPTVSTTPRRGSPPGSSRSSARGATARATSRAGSRRTSC